MDTDSLPLACAPGGIAPDERGGHFALLGRLFAAAGERRALDDGYAFRFAADALGDVARFVENERRCCPFLRFDITLEPAGGPLWLRLTGPAGTRELLDAELPLHATDNGIGDDGDEDR